MITLIVKTINGKSQEFLVNPQKLVGDIKAQIQKNHKYITNLPADQEIKLLYKGIELDEIKTLEFYAVCDKSNIQIIHKTKPISISFKSSAPISYHENRRDSLPTSIFENYAPSPLDLDITNRFSKSNSPNFGILADQGKDIMRSIQSLQNSMEYIIDRMNKLEDRVNHIYESVVIPKR